MKPKFAVFASYAATVLAALFAVAALPFIIIAGIGLLLVLPFGFFFIKENAVRDIVKSGKPLSKKMRTARGLRVAYCLIGMETMLGFLWWANSIGGTPDERAATMSFIYNSLWALAVAFVLYLPQLLSRKK